VEDEVTCPVCGRERTAWTPEKTLGAFAIPWAEAAKCWHGNDGASDREHWRLGYERSQAALAAARRAEAAAKEAHAYCLLMFSREWLTEPKNRSIFAAQIFRTLEAALAAPAAGEEGKRAGIVSICRCVVITGGYVFHVAGCPHAGRQ
jgi:hypothetical protein